MTKQQQDQKALKENLQYALDHFKEFSEKHRRPNYLMAIGISCRKGTFCFHYGGDPVAEDCDRAKAVFAARKKKKCKQKK